MSLILRIPIHLYRWIISPVLRALCGGCGCGCGCRFHPSCSTYALESLKVYGSLQGSLLAIRRISKCHPWGESGFDPVPSPKPSAFTLNT